jgi:hypothetical protein
MTSGKQSLQEHLPLLFVILCIVFLFIRLPLTGESLYGSDFVLYFYPLKEFVRDHVLTHGALPLWNAYQFSGTPLIGNIQASLFYPLGFLFYLLPSDQAYGYTVVMHCFLASFFMYSFMRTAAVSKAASLLSALIFTFSGFFMGHLYAGHLTFIQNYIWIPLIFRYLYRLVQTRRLFFAIAAGLVQGIQILGGFPQIAFYTILAGAAFLGFHAFYLLKARCRGDAMRVALGMGIVWLIGYGLSAVQVAPTAEFAKLSTRGEGLNYAMATYESLHPKELLAFLVPDLFGSAVDQTYWRSRDFWHFWESCGYLGMVPLFLAFVKAQEPSLRRLRMFFLLLIVLVLALALGKHNPLYEWVYRLPGFSSFRIPAQIIFLYVFGVAALAGIGADQVQKGAWTWSLGFIPFVVLCGLGLAVAVVGLHFEPYHFFLNLFRSLSEGPVTHANLDGLYQRVGQSIHTATLLFCAALGFLVVSRRTALGSRTILVILFALITVDLLPFGRQLVKTYPFSTSPGKAAVLSQLSGTPVQGRVVTMDPQFKTNDGLRYRFPSVLGYDPLILKRYADYLLSGQGYPPDQHVVDLHGIRDPEARLLKFLNVRQAVMDGQVFPVENELPYAYLVHHALPIPPERVIGTMKSGQVDPRKTVILEEPLAEDLASGKGEEPFRDVCHVLAHTGERVTLKTSSDSAGYLVVSEIFYPGWTAEVDGRKSKVMRGNYLFCVIPLEKGDHQVNLYFVSWPFRIGAGISCLTLIIALLVIFRRRRSAEKDSKA